MSYSTCCGAHTTMPEMGICPDCLEHCDWEEDDEEVEQDKQTENKIEEEKLKNK